MKKIFIVFFLLGLYSLSFAGFGGDSLGSHKATKSLDMTDHDIDNVDNIECNSFSGSPDGSNIVNLSTAASPAGFTTYYFQLSGGGDVWVATNAFIPITGCFAKTPTTWTITGVKFFNVYHSTCAFTKYNIAHSTDTGDTCTTLWSYIFTNDVEVTTNTKQSGWQEPNTNTINAYQYLALHIRQITAIGGDLASEFGAIIRYVRKE